MLASVAEDFNKAASSYDEAATLQRHIALSLYEQASMANKTGLILDAGCGTGYLASLHHKKGHMFGIDLAYSMCTHTSPIYPTVNGNILALPIARKSIDCYWSNLAYQWLPSIKTAFLEAQHILKPGGTYAISCFTAGTMQELVELYKHFNLNPPVIQFPTEQIFKQICGKQSTIHTDIITQTYPNFYTLCKTLKSLGATYKERPSQMTKGLWYNLSEQFEHRYHNSLSWHVTYITGEQYAS